MSVTDGDRERVVEIIRQALADEKWLSMGPYRLHVYRLAAALADEREKALAPFLALADELDSEAQGRWVRTLEAREAADRDAAFGERGAGDALHDAAVRIRRAAEVTE